MNVKCQVCGQKNERDEMVKETIHKQNKYYHPPCHEQFLEEKEAKRIENEEWIELYELVKIIHNFQVLNSGIIECLQNLRHGTVKVGGVKKKRYKEGVPYGVIIRAYRACERQLGKIRESKSGDFKNDYQEFAYCFSVVLNRINEEFRKAKTQESQKVATSTEIQVASRSQSERKFRKTEQTELEDLLSD